MKREQTPKSKLRLKKLQSDVYNILTRGADKRANSELRLPNSIMQYKGVSLDLRNIKLPSSIIMLDLSGCMVEDIVPLLVLKNLRMLLLSRNKIVSLPEEFPSMNSLQFLDLSLNGLTSLEPISKFKDLSSLLYINIAQNPVKGYRKALISCCNSLSVVDDLIVSEVEIINYRISVQDVYIVPECKLPPLLFSFVRYVDQHYPLFPNVKKILDSQVKMLQNCVKSCSFLIKIQRRIRIYLNRKKFQAFSGIIHKLQGLVRGYLFRRRLLAELVKIVSPRVQATTMTKESEKNLREYVSYRPQNLHLKSVRLPFLSDIIKRCWKRYQRQRRLLSYVDRIVWIFRYYIADLKRFKFKMTRNKYPRFCFPSSRFGLMRERLLTFGWKMIISNTIPNEAGDKSQFVMDECETETTGVVLPVYLGREEGEIFHRQQITKFSPFSPFYRFRRFKMEEWNDLCFDLTSGNQTQCIHRKYCNFPLLKASKIRCRGHSRLSGGEWNRIRARQRNQNPENSISGNGKERHGELLIFLSWSSLKPSQVYFLYHFAKANDFSQKKKVAIQDICQLARSDDVSNQKAIKGRSIDLFMEEEGLQHGGIVPLQALIRGYLKRQSLQKWIQLAMIQNRAVLAIQRWWRYSYYFYRRLRFLQILSNPCHDISKAPHSQKISCEWKEPFLYIDAWVLFRLCQISSLCELSSSFQKYPEFRGVPRVNPSTKKCEFSLLDMDIMEIASCHGLANLQSENSSRSSSWWCANSMHRCGISSWLQCPVSLDPLQSTKFPMNDDANALDDFRQRKQVKNPFAELLLEGVISISTERIFLPRSIASATSMWESSFTSPENGNGRLKKEEDEMEYHIVKIQYVDIDEARRRCMLLSLLAMSFLCSKKDCGVNVAWTKKYWLKGSYFLPSWGNRSYLEQILYQSIFSKATLMANEDFHASPLLAKVQQYQQWTEGSTLSPIPSWSFSWITSFAWDPRSFPATMLQKSPAEVFFSILPEPVWAPPFLCATSHLRTFHNLFDEWKKGTHSHNMNIMTIRQSIESFKEESKASSNPTLFIQAKYTGDKNRLHSPKRNNMIGSTTTSRSGARSSKLSTLTLEPDFLFPTTTVVSNHSRVNLYSNINSESKYPGDSLTTTVPTTPTVITGIVPPPPTTATMAKNHNNCNNCSGNENDHNYSVWDGTAESVSFPVGKLTELSEMSQNIELPMINVEARGITPHSSNLSSFAYPSWYQSSVTLTQGNKNISNSFDQLFQEEKVNQNSNSKRGHKKGQKNAIVDNDNDDDDDDDDGHGDVEEVPSVSNLMFSTSFVTQEREIGKSKSGVDVHDNDDDYHDGEELTSTLPWDIQHLMNSTSIDSKEQFSFLSGSFLPVPTSSSSVHDVKKVVTPVLYGSARPMVSHNDPLDVLPEKECPEIVSSSFKNSSSLPLESPLHASLDSQKRWKAHLAAAQQQERDHRQTQRLLYQQWMEIDQRMRVQKANEVREEDDRRQAYRQSWQQSFVQNVKDRECEDRRRVMIEKETQAIHFQEQRQHQKEMRVEDRKLHEQRQEIRHWEEGFQGSLSQLLKEQCQRQQQELKKKEELEKRAVVQEKRYLEHGKGNHSCRRPNSAHLRRSTPPIWRGSWTSGDSQPHWVLGNSERNSHHAHSKKDHGDEHDYDDNDHNMDEEAMNKKKNRINGHEYGNPDERNPEGRDANGLLPIDDSWIESLPSSLLDSTLINNRNLRGNAGNIISNFKPLNQTVINLDVNLLPPMKANKDTSMVTNSHNKSSSYLLDETITLNCSSSKVQPNVPNPPASYNVPVHHRLARPLSGNTTNGSRSRPQSAGSRYSRK